LRRAVVAEGPREPVGKVPAVLEQALKGNVLRDVPVVEVHGDAAARGQLAAVRHAGVYLVARHVLPGRGADLAHGLGLPGGQQRKLDAELGQDFEGFGVYGRLGQPDAFRLAAEAVLKVGNPPLDLRDLVAAAGQGHDEVAVHLGQGRAVPRKFVAAVAVGLQNGLVSFRLVLFHPREQRGAEVEAHPGVVVDNVNNGPVGAQDARGGVLRVAFGRDPFVPVVERIGRVLNFNGFHPGVFARRLVEVPVDADVFVRVHASVNKAATGFGRCKEVNLMV
jgi:hypothetical protein